MPVTKKAENNFLSMKQTKFLTLIFSSVFFAAGFLSFADGEISAWTEEKALEFVTLRVQLKNSKNLKKTAETLDQFEADALAQVESYAIDLEQEKLIFQTLVYIERYENFNSRSNRAEYRKQAKELMKRNHHIIDSRGFEKTSKWTYYLSGDITSYYMTRSIPATLLYGLRVKSWYQEAIKKDKYMPMPNVSLGNWYFFAPGIMGGSKKTAGECYKRALEGAKVTGEKYLIYLYYSQYLFDKKDKKAASYLEMAYDLNVGNKELNKITELNCMGTSYFEFMRTRAGIDEEIPEEEKDEDDR